MYGARLAESLPAVRERLAGALERAGRRDEVAIVAVTKGHGAEAVEALLAAGLDRFGENRVQELEQKVEAVGRDRAEWHLIGHLQRNKVRRALPLFDLVHSIDSLRLAQELSKEAERAGREVCGLVQVNTSGEATKGGLSAAEAVEVVGRIVELPGLRVQGLMTMAPLSAEERVVRGTFAAARDVFEACARQIPQFEPRHLS